MTDRLPPRLRARAADERLQVPAPRCYCGRPVPTSSGCGCCCGEHSYEGARS